MRVAKKLIVSYMGDSLAYIIKNDGSFLSGTPIPHNLSIESERKKVMELGGNVTSLDEVFRLNGRFCLSRSFGDPSMAKHLISDPETLIHEITNDDKFVVLGSDGFWDGIRIEDFSTDLSQQRSDEDIRECLEKYFEEAKVNIVDNVTVILAKLN
ncbi:putative protein phosphatase 2C 25 [Thelohanellus kitauei]|uniref:PPM-type phosphatase domain-containing protein n=1 Tax=Thelohanellus kitauei TaxID=669202 RepID=A0A0C2JTM9_THEKT|nr:putative protein phosphatase 2C 25 [Thelohanellus kitauei]